MTDSPFLPGTKLQYAWDSSSLGLLKTCPRLYQYTILDGWSTEDEPIDLRFGTEFHLTAQSYEVSRAAGSDHQSALTDAIGQLHERTADFDPSPDTKSGKYKSRQNLICMMVDYFDKYGDNDPAVTYIRADGRPAVELSFKFSLDYGPGIQSNLIERALETTARQPYLLCGHLDRVVTLNSALLVMDYKTTTKTITERYFAQYEPNNQMSLYTLAGRIILGAPIRGVVISAAQLLLEEPHRFVRGFTYRTQDQLDEWLSDLSILLRLNEAYAANNYWPQNDTACDKYGGCKFREICSKSPDARDRFLKSDFIQLEEQNRWNPLKPR
jgi:hypothetical protein